MPNATTPTLIAFSGLPGVGKTTIARDLARGLEALYLRVDSIEAALKNSSLRIHPAEDAGYQALIAIARDNLANCLTVIADTSELVRQSCFGVQIQFAQRGSCLLRRGRA
jgi:predicted kinase